MDIEFVGFGEIAVDGKTFDYDLIVEKGKVRRRKKGPSKTFRDQFGHTPLSIDEDIPWSADRLVVGTGANGRLPVMQKVRETAMARGVELVELPTPDAVELLRSAKPKKVNAIIHVTC